MLTWQSRLGSARGPSPAAGTAALPQSPPRRLYMSSCHPAPAEVPLLRTDCLAVVQTSQAGCYCLQLRRVASVRRKWARKTCSPQGTSLTTVHIRQCMTLLQASHPVVENNAQSKCPRSWVKQPSELYLLYLPSSDQACCKEFWTQQMSRRCS